MSQRSRWTFSCLVLVAVGLAACGDGAGKGEASSQATGSGKPASSAQSSAASAKASATTGATSATSAATAAGGLEVLGGSDWHAVFVGDPPVKVGESMGGGQGSGVTDDYTTKTPHADPPWKFNAAGGGGVYWAPSKKAVAVSNVNLKRDADEKAVDTWIKSALVTEVKHTTKPEIVEIGPTKAVAKAGAGTCKLKGGEEASFYWWDIYSEGDFSHNLMIVIVAKDAPEEDKKVALSILRQVSFTPKAKPHYKK